MRLKELNPQEGEVLRIKFKPINQIMDENLEKQGFHEIEEYFQIQNNIKAYISGGDFLVCSSLNIDEDHKDNPYIEVKNHFDNNYEFAIHESVIDTIEEVDAAEIFCSHDLKIVVVRIDHEMFINGHPLIWNEADCKRHDEDYTNHNRKFINMFEGFIADLAVRDTFEGEG